MGDLLHWKRTEISVLISSLIPSTVIHFQCLPGHLTWAQTLITPFAFLSPIEEPSAGDWEAGNTCGPTFPVPPRELPGLPESLPNPQRGTRWLLLLRTRRRPHAAGTACHSAPGRHSGASPRLHRAPRARCSAAANAAPTGCPRERGRPWGDTAPAPAGTAQHGAPTPPGAGQDRSPGARRSLRAPLPTASPQPLGRLRHRARPPPSGAIDAPRSGRWPPLPRGTAASPAAGGSPPLRGGPRPTDEGTRHDSRLAPPSPRPAGAARGKVTDPRSPPGSIKRRGPARRRHGNKRVSLPPASGGGGGRAAERGSASAGAVPTGAPPPPPPLRTPHVETPLPRPRQGPRHVGRTPQAARTGGRGAGRGGGGGAGK